jgi:hypothetical protein
MGMIKGTRERQCPWSQGSDMAFFGGVLIIMGMGIHAHVGYARAWGDMSMGVWGMG